ncbi:MAG: ABC transporter permease subunit [Planctomycetota bacterium]
MIPIMRREFLSILRSPRALVAILASAALFSLLVLVRWPSTGIVDLSGAQAREVYKIFAFGLLGGVLLLVPAFPATSIVKERIQGTLLLLLNSPLSPPLIYLGKLLGVLAFAAVILCTSLPAAAACYAMGGVDLWGDVGLLYAVLAVLAIESVALGLLVSTYSQSPDAAVRISYGLLFAVCFLTLAPHYLMQGQAGGASAGELPRFVGEMFGETLSPYIVTAMIESAFLLRRLSPLPVILHLVGQGSAGSQGLLETDTGAREFFVTSSIFIAGVILLTLRQLNHRIFDRSRSQGKITNDQSLGVRSLRRLFFLVDPQRRSAGIPFFLNPIMVKEFRTRRFGRIHWLLRLVAICAVVSLLMTFAATTSTMDWGVETIGGLLVLLQVTLVVLITPSLAAGLISNEVESGGWNLLRMTTLPGWRIVTGKLASVAWTVVLLLFATAPGYIVMIFIKPTMLQQVYQVMICLLLTVIYTMAVSAAVGCWINRTAAATVTVYIILMVLFLGPLLVWLGREAPFGHDLVQRVLAINPMGAALSVIGMPGFERYNLTPLSWWVAGFVSLVSLLVMSLRVWRLLKPA